MLELILGGIAVVGFIADVISSATGNESAGHISDKINSATSELSKQGEKMAEAKDKAANMTDSKLESAMHSGSIMDQAAAMAEYKHRHQDE